MAAAEAATANGGGGDLKSILSTKGRDFLIRNNGEQIKVTDLNTKVVCLYFSASWCGPCRRFTPKLIETYNELSLKGRNFEVVFVSSDHDQDSFQEYFSKMPWLAIPFSDSDTRDHLDGRFGVIGIPHLVVLDGSGKVLTDAGVQAVSYYGSEGYPFTPGRFEKIKVDEEAAKKEQTLQSVLASASRDFVISNNENKVPISEMEGKIVGLLFSMGFVGSCEEFTPILVDMYKKLKEIGENFEVVLVCLDDDESSFKLHFAGMPWLAIPFKDKICDRLVRYFDLEKVPALVVIGSDGKTLHANAAEIVEEYGVEAYPFSPEKLEEIAEKEKARLEAQTLESLLVSKEQNYVIGNGDIKVPVSELVGKNILLYFSAHWCPPCRAFLPKLIDAYHKIKEKDSAFEVIFVSSDENQTSFDDFFSGMPWLALPFGDERKKHLNRRFKIEGIPSLVAIGPTGKTVTKEARELVRVHGADAYPFTEEHIKQLEAEAEERAKGWPEKLRLALHEEHDLVRSRRKAYICDKCEDDGDGWSFYCKECDFDLHPKCALEDDGKTDVGADHNEEQKNVGKEGYICDGDVCYKA